jgi:hypothetical protein
MDLLTIMKVAGALITGVFGMLAAVINIRRPDNKISGLGKFFIVGSILGVMTVTISQILETREQDVVKKKSDSDSLTATLRLEKIMLDLNRSLQPITNFEVYFVGNHISLDDNFFSSYRRRLDKAIAEHLKKTPFQNMRDKNLESDLFPSSSQSEATRIVVPKDSIYSPQKAGEFIGLRMLPLCYDFVFFRNPIDPKYFKAGMKGGSAFGDLSYMGFGSEDIELVKKLDSNSFELRGKVNFSDGSKSNATGNFISIPDLAGSQIFFSACTMTDGFSFNPKTPEKKTSFKIKLDFRPGTMIFKLGDRSFSIAEDKWVKYEGALRPYWSYTFPHELSEIFIK